jgi:hypothetical protein
LKVLDGWKRYFCMGRVQWVRSDRFDSIRFDSLRVVIQIEQIGRFWRSSAFPLHLDFENRQVGWERHAARATERHDQ